MVVAKQPGEATKRALPDRLPVELREAVDELGQPLGAGVCLGVPPLVGGRVLEPEVPAHVHDLHAGDGGDLRQLLGRHGVGQPQQDHVHAPGRLGRRDRLEAEIGELLQRRVGRRERLPHEVDRGDPHQLHVRVDEQPADHLRPAVARAADHRRPVALAGCHAPPLYRERRQAASAGVGAHLLPGTLRLAAEEIWHGLAARRCARVAGGAAHRHGVPPGAAGAPELVHRQPARGGGGGQPGRRPAAGPGPGGGAPRLAALRPPRRLHRAGTGSADLPPRPHRHRLPSRHLRGLPARRRPRDRAGGLRHEGRRGGDALRPGRGQAGAAAGAGPAARGAGRRTRRSARPSRAT